MLICPSCNQTFADGTGNCPDDGSALVVDAVRAVMGETLTRGTVVGEYEIITLVGKGAYGTVYSAHHPLIGKSAAIKVLGLQHSADPSIVSRFLSEARAVNQIRHPYIIDIYSFGKLDDGRHYYVMELLEGRTLREHLADHAPLEPQAAVTILRRVARALDAAHKAKIAHRDLKPDNVFLTFMDEEIFPKLLDFGIAKLMDENAEAMHRTATGAAVGTPLYMSPEQWRAQPVDHRADIWALGVIAFEMFTGTMPFQCDSVGDLIVEVIAQPAPKMSSRRPGLEALDAAVDAMLQKPMDARPASAGAAINAVADAVAGLGVALPSASQTFDHPPAVSAAASASSNAAGHTVAPITHASSTVGQPLITPQIDARRAIAESAATISAAPASAATTSAAPISAATISAAPISAAPISAAPVSAAPPISAASLGAQPAAGLIATNRPLSRTLPVTAAPRSRTALLGIAALLLGGVAAFFILSRFGGSSLESTDTSPASAIGQHADVDSDLQPTATATAAEPSAAVIASAAASAETEAETSATPTAAAAAAPSRQPLRPKAAPPRPAPPRPAPPQPAKPAPPTNAYPVQDR